MKDTGKSAKANVPGKTPRGQLWTGLVGDIKRKIEKFEAMKQHEKSIKTPAQITADSTKWMTLFTFVLAVVGIVTTCILKNQLDSMRLDQRAWVAPVDTALRSEPERNGNGTIFVVPFSNTGKTPAINVHAWINRTSRINQVGDDKNNPSTPGMLLAPGGIGNTSTANIPLDPTEVDNIRKEGLLEYVYGTIWYRDIFGKDHWTQFCFYPGSDLKSFGPCDRHNQTDDTEKK